MTVEAFEVMAKATIYEPFVEQDANKDKIYHYVFDSPDNLLSYLTSFIHPSKQQTNFVESPPLLQCCGHGNLLPPHHFLAAEGHHICLKVVYCSAIPVVTSVTRRKRRCISRVETKTFV